MFGSLLSIYVVAIWPAAHNAVHWHEYQLSHNFFSRNVCEQYRPKLVHAWVADPDTPFRTSNVASSRCGRWEPDQDSGEPI